ncbi:hypothetical protein Q361_1712 [Flavobacterium croceum DSM 17960]|uniref:Uncharacterized protein n=1 Tax=Flavobacterium croceum DSM 17960 TaxID=1121886 RepID=A0A2S4N4A4_9FLAO|nr:hypothetical protein [Flavobacterium croceum]POS00537.1 hypothetical protein Q361_1712 [Flavobacterium croceum DSM 17960]
MKKIIICSLLILALTSFKSVGSATAHLTCKSESGRTTFKAEIQDIDEGIEKAELTIDGVKLNFTEDESSNIVFDSKNGVYTIVIESKSQLQKDFSKFKFLKFWAIPKTFKTIIENNTEGKYEFKARLYSTEPRKGKDLQTPEIEMNCNLEYKI